jgi:hypothetical protein
MDDPALRVRIRVVHEYDPAGVLGAGERECARNRVDAGPAPCTLVPLPRTSTERGSGGGTCAAARDREAASGDWDANTSAASRGREAARDREAACVP